MQENIAIPMNEIINNLEHEPIETVGQLLQHLRDRQTYFSSVLAAILGKIPYFSGWQKIGRNPDGTIQKQSLESPSKEGMFTGEYWCTTAALATGEAIEQLIAKNNLLISVEIANMSTDFQAEDGPYRVLKDAVVSHTILKITGKNGESFLIDPTYAQVNHTFAGRFLIIPETQCKDFYQSRSDTVAKFVPLSTFGNTQISKSLIDPESFRRLVNTLL